MKLIRILALNYLTVALCLGLAGCAHRGLVSPLSNGYSEVGHSHGDSDDTDSTRIALRYQDPAGKGYVVWPSLSGAPEVIRGNTAIFVGDKAYVPSNQFEQRGMKPRLFAVQAPGLPMDITDEVVQRWSKESEKNYAKAKAILSMVTPAAADGKLVIQLEFWTEEPDWPDKATIQLGWDQVSDLMRDVKEKGAVHKDLRWGAPYIEK